MVKLGTGACEGLIFG